MLTAYYQGVSLIAITVASTTLTRSTNGAPSFFDGRPAVLPWNPVVRRPEICDKHCVLQTRQCRTRLLHLLGAPF